MSDNNLRAFKRCGLVGNSLLLAVFAEKYSKAREKISGFARGRDFVSAGSAPSSSETVGAGGLLDGLWRVKERTRLYKILTLEPAFKQVTIWA